MSVNELPEQNTKKVIVTADLYGSSAVRPLRLIGVPPPGTSQLGQSTRSVHEGSQRYYDRRSLTLPAFNTATYVFNDTADLCAHKEEEISSEDHAYDYGRYGNPSVDVCERRLARLDSGEDAVLFTSGMGAVSAALLGLLRAGDHIVIGAECYRKTRVLCNDLLRRFGVSVSVVTMGDYEALENAIRPQTKLLFYESPTNPYLRVVDLERLVEIARHRDILTVIDSTFATPINQRPLEFGVDLVIHSATKYLSGNNDVMAGVVLGKKKYTNIIRDYRGTVGGIPCATVAVKLEQSLKTLAIRVERQNQNTLKIAKYLEENPFVERVWYPGLESHPDYLIAAQQMAGFGGVVSFEVRGGLDEAARLIDCVKIPKIAASLGGVESLIEQPAIISFYRLTTEERLAIGIKDNLVRFAVGIEDVEDILSDLEQAFDQAFSDGRQGQADILVSVA
jgi:cystathionine gamma-synthase